MKWQPIETAPRDGTDIFIWSHIINKPISVHWRSDDGGDWFISDCLPYCIDPYPTHWMPIPPPPQTDTAAPVEAHPDSYWALCNPTREDAQGAAVSPVCETCGGERVVTVPTFIGQGHSFQLCRYCNGTGKESK